MGTTKIHINLKQGILEAEGSESFVEKIYRDFKDNIKLENPTTTHENNTPTPIEKQNGESNVTSTTKVIPIQLKPLRTKTKSNSSDGALVKDLDLTGGKSKESLRDFCAKYIVKSNMERNLIFTYYLEHNLEIKNIGVDHIFTCYRNIPATKLPKNLKQSLYDTSAKGWIAVKSIDDNISVPRIGINHIEHDLPKAGSNT